MRTFRPGGLGVLLAVLVITACGGATRSQSDRSAQPAADLAELEAIYRARTDSARMRFSEADARFMRSMIGHHAQAIVMASLAPGRTVTPSILTLAARIISAQQDEIELMQQWLRDRGQPVPEVHIAGTTLHVSDTLHAHGQMPGMITAAQLAELERAQGTAFDRLLLTYMIEHHRGAVTMVHELLGTDGAAQDVTVFRFASDVQVDQITEIARMEQMLRSYRTDPVSP